MATAQEQQIVDEVTEGGEPTEIDIESYNYATFATLEDMDQEWVELPPDTEARALRKVIMSRERWLEGCRQEYRQYLLGVLSEQDFPVDKDSSLEELEEIYESGRGALSQATRIPHADASAHTNL